MSYGGRAHLGLIAGAHLRTIRRLLLGAATVNNWSDHKYAIPERSDPRPRSRPLRRSCLRPWLVTNQTEFGEISSPACSRQSSSPSSWLWLRLCLSDRCATEI